MDSYKVPLNFTRIFETNSRNLSKCGEKESIDQNIEMIITTCPGEHKYDVDFGCKIWDLDFERVVSQSSWEDQFNQYIAFAIEKYEPRISGIDCRVHFADVKREYQFSGATSIRKKVDIQIDADIVETGERCCFYYSLYLGPLSSD